MTHCLRLSLLLAALALVVGCNKNDDAIRSYAAPKEQPAPSLAAGENSPGMGDQASQGAQGLAWKVPAGWKQLPGDAVRAAVFQVSPTDTQALLTVVPLGPEGREVKPNVSRWAGQLKLPPPSDADMGKYVTPTQISGEKADLVDLTGPAEGGREPQRVLAALVEHDGQTWTFNLKGPASVVGGQKSNFEQFVHSVQFAVGAAQSAAPPPEHAAAAAGAHYKLVKWKTPPGWVETPGSNAMRVTAFQVGSGAESAAVIVARLPQDQVGTMLDNINRWRGEVGLEPALNSKEGGFEPKNVAGMPGLFASYAGPSTRSAPARQLLVAMTVAGPDVWFIKMLGPQELVARQRDAFNQFVDSMNLEPESK